MKSFMTAGAIAALASGAGAQEISITFENLLPGTGTAFTPVFFGLGDGSFDLFDPGGTASAGLEDVAEIGQTGALSAEFAAADPTGLFQTSMGGPVIGGGSTTVTFDVTDPASASTLVFATMVVPTNDLFIGNPNGIEIFDSSGEFVGPFTITIFGSQVWDAGTEVNDALNGGAFLQGVAGTAGTETPDGTVELFFQDPNADAYLASLVGLTTAPGFDIGSTFTELTPIAQLTVVPTPAGISAAVVVGVIAGRRRRS